MPFCVPFDEIEKVGLGQLVLMVDLLSGETSSTPVFILKSMGTLYSAHIYTFPFQ